MKIILASQSPRRWELLARLGLPFSAQAPDIDETMEPGEDPAPEDVVIAADTIVVCNGRVLGKPGTPGQAQQMLRLLSGRDHQVMTGLTVRRGATVLTETEVSRIFFRPLQEEEIAAYVATGEPLDKAGAYGIQGVAALFITRLEGDFYNVMGLPLCALTLQLRRLGVKILGV